MSQNIFIIFFLSLATKKTMDEKAFNQFLKQYIISLHSTKSDPEQKLKKNNYASIEQFCDNLVDDIEMFITQYNSDLSSNTSMLVLQELKKRYMLLISDLMFILDLEFDTELHEVSNQYDLFVEYLVQTMKLKHKYYSKIYSKTSPSLHLFAPETIDKIKKDFKLNNEVHIKPFKLTPPKKKARKRKNNDDEIVKPNDSDDK